MNKISFNFTLGGIVIQHINQCKKLIVLFIVLGILPMMLVGIQSTRNSIKSMEEIRDTTLEEKLKADIKVGYVYLQNYFGGIRLEGNKLVDEKGKDIATTNKMIDKLSEDLNVKATIFIKEKDEYRRVLTSIKAPDTKKRLVNTLLNNKEVESLVEKNENYIGNTKIFNDSYLCSYAPIKDSGGNLVGLLFIGIPCIEVNQVIAGEVSGTRLSNYVLIGIISVIGLIIMVVCANGISKPLIELVKASDSLSHYNLKDNISSTLKHRGDEIGSLAVALEKIEDQLKVIVLKVKATAMNLNQTSSGLVDNCKESTQSINEIAKAIQEIAEGATEQANNTAECSTRLERLGELVDQNAVQLECLNEMSEQVIISSDEGKKVIKDLTFKIEESNKKILEAYDKVNQTDESVNRIEEASSIISSIAEQTNLLALNASIEAARAGEYGKGFNVVATEIKKLAMQSEKFTKKIDTQINKLKEDSNYSLKSIGEVKETLLEQTMYVSDTESKYTQIQYYINDTEKCIRKLTALGKEMYTQKQEVSIKVESLSALAEQNAAATEESAACIEEQDASIERLCEFSETLLIKAESLLEMIKCFKM